MTEKPFSQACENNKGPILRHLRREFASSTKILEIGSGTGQHAVYFADEMRWLEWQASDRVENHAGILTWIADATRSKLRPPLELDVRGDWPGRTYDGIFTANTFHIMSWEVVLLCIGGMAEVLRAGGRIAVYGPFRVGGECTSPSNVAFDESLRESDPAMGIRDIADVCHAFRQFGITLYADFAMPANNRLLFFRREEAIEH